VSKSPYAADGEHNCQHDMLIRHTSKTWACWTEQWRAQWRAIKKT